MARRPVRRAAATIALASVTVGTFALATPGPASAEMLLEQPPREVEFRLDVPRRLASVDLLQTLREVEHDRLGPMRLYTTGRFGTWIREPRWSLAWNPLADGGEAGPPALTFESEIPIDFDLTGEQAEPIPFEVPELDIVRERKWMSRFDFGVRPSFDTTGFGLKTDGFSNVFRFPSLKPVVDWRCRRKPVQILRSGGEGDRFDLVRCDGSVAPEALDRLSILARPPEVARPGDVLPDEPAAEAWSSRREWTNGVRVVHPRLVWALQQIADAFPRKAVVLYSGYRPLAEVNDGSGHRSFHADGRALDIAVHKVSNDDLFRVCTKLKGIGCGFYPNHKFVHIDVRRAGPGEAFFIDGSNPGEPAKYLTDYPGLVESGKLIKAAK
ncbi:MAG: DUF882 domain-containing protein [Polyangiaceae bacterium]|nr:DUF882 domain-containing protein [Polyangiaceae bacterium]